MKRASSPIHWLTAASDSTTFVMASRPTHRGRGRGRGRGFSAPPYSGGTGQFVSGDEHFRSVRDANLGFQPVDSGSFSNQTRYQNPAFNPRPPPPYHQTPQFRHPHPFNQPQRFRPLPSFDQKPAIHPRKHHRPRPPDYRDWECATTPPDPDRQRFIVLSYNILADYLAIDHRGKLYYHIPLYMLDWRWRKRNLLTELGLWSADIMCLQEVDRFHDLEEEFKLKGYSGIWKMRTGNAVDGCAIFWRKSRFKLLHEECIEFNKLGLRDNVAQICVLELINQKGALPSSFTGSCKVVICNIHVLYNPNRGDIKLGQVRVLLERAKAVSNSWNDAPVVICGDFNCTPKSPLYNFITEQKLYLSGVERNKVSGQASAVIGPPRQYRPNPSEMPPHCSVKGSSIVGDKEVNIEPSNCLSDTLNLSNQENNVKNQQTGIVLDVMSDQSLTNEQHGKESGTLYDARKDTHLNAVDNAKNLGEVDSLKEDSHASNSEGRSPVDDMPIASSASEVVHSNAIGMGCAEQISDAIPPSTRKILNETSNLYAPKENESMKFDSSPTCLQEDYQSSRIKIAPESIGPLTLETSSTESSSQNSISNVIETENGDSLSCELANDQVNSSSTSYQVDESPQLANFHFPLDEKLQNLSLDEIDKTMIGSENIEDANDFISALHNGEEGFSHGLENSDQFKLESASFNTPLHQQSNEMEDDLPPIQNPNTIDAGRSLWTPMEIETATGNAECTILEHQLLLRSTYTEVTGCSGTRDSSGEPLVTSYNRCFSGTVDYIWRSKGLQTIRVLAPIPKHAMEWTPGFPTKKWGSDHIALVSELAFLKDVTHGRDVQ